MRQWYNKTLCILICLNFKKTKFQWDRETIGWVQGDCSLDLNNLRAKLTFTICSGAIRQGLSKFLLFSKRSLVIANWSPDKSACLLFSCDNLISKDNFANFCVKNLQFKSDHAILHDGMLTKFIFWWSLCEKKWGYQLYFRLFFEWCLCEVCCVWQHAWNFVKKSSIFTWYCKFWKLIDTKGQILNDL